MNGFGDRLPPLAELAPAVRRLVAPNPSMMTGPGTNTYLLGTNSVAVLDPGPAIARHVDAILETAGAPIRWILVTHTHPDHSPAARELAARTGASLIGRRPPAAGQQDRTFVPDREPADEDTLRIAGIDLEIIYTPGHASNHVCYRHAGLNWLFTGDHVIDGSTVVINPPDGNMRAYIASLMRCRDLDCSALAPGHGDLITDPARAIDWIIAHRLEREARVVAAMTAHPKLTLRELVSQVYTDVDPQLHRLAERSLLAHLEKLAADDKALIDDGRWRLR